MPIQDYFTEEQISSLVYSHCRRVIDNMNHDDIINYAIQMMIDSFDKDPGVGNTDVDRLLGDIYEAELGDLDSVSEFLEGEGIPQNVVDTIMGEYQFE